MQTKYTHKIPVRNWGKSLTEPDQNYTVKELFQRFARGLPIQAAKQQPTYLHSEDEVPMDNVDIEKLSRMSRMDKLEQLDEIRLKAELLDTELADKEAERSEAHKKAEEEKAAKA